MNANASPHRRLESSEVSAADATREVLSHVQAVADRANRWMRWRGILLFLATSIAVVGLTVGVDWLWKTPPPEARFGLTILVLLSVVLAGWKWLVVVWRTVASPLQAARRMERVFPQLGDRLSSIVALRGEPTQPAESSTQAESPLIDLAIHHTASQLHSLDGFQALDGRRLRFATGWAMLAMGLAVASVAFVPPIASLGVQRLAMPWADLPWPRTDYLKLRAADAVPAGQPLELQLENVAGRPLPSDVHLSWRPAGTQDALRVPVDVDDGQATLGSELTLQTFEVRASGGDDDTMPWQRVDVVMPPVLTNVVFQVTPPASTGAPPFVESRERFAVPENSAFVMQGQVDRRIESLTLLVDGRPISATLQSVDGERGDAPEVKVVADWQLENVGDELVIELRWTDREGVTGTFPQRYRVQVLEDTPPVVQWRKPQEDLQVTTQAVLELEFSARDNYGLRTTGVQLDAANELETEAKLWWQQRANGARDQNRSLTVTVSEALQQRSEQNRDPSGAETPLAADSAQQAPDPLVLFAVAEDSAGQTGRSRGLRIYFLSEDEVRTQLTRESQRVLERLREATKSQQIAAERTREAGLQSDPQQAEDSLQIANAAQQQALQQLDQDPEAALKIAQQVLRRAETNRLESPFLESFQQAVEQLDALRQTAVEPAAEQLAAAGEAAKEASKSKRQAAIEQAASLQAAAVAEMQQVGEDLAAGLESQSMAESIRDVAAAQQRLAAATERSIADKDPALAESLASQQREIARQTDRLRQELGELSESTEPTGPGEQAFQAAAERLLDEQISPRMREAADALKRGQPAAAAASQQEIAKDMRAIAEAATGSQQAAADSPQQLAARATELARRQRETVEQIETTLRREGVDSEAAVAKQSDALAAANELRNQLESMPLFPQSLDRAKQSMQSAVARIKRDPTDSRAMTDARAAQELLDEIADSIAQTANESPSAEPAGNDSPQPEEAGDAADQRAQQPLPLASLFLMRSMQVRLKNQTAAWEAQAATPVTDDDAAAARQTQRRRLTEQQTELAENLKQLLETAQQASSSESESTDGEQEPSDE